MDFANAAMDRANLMGGDVLAGRVSRLASQDAGSEAEAVSREMESLFATLLVSELRKGLGDGFFGSGPGADTFNGWFDEQIGSSLASRSSLGLTEQIQEAIIREQEAKAAANERASQEGGEQNQGRPRR